MKQFVAGGLASLCLATGGFMLWNGRAATTALPPAPVARAPAEQQDAPIHLAAIGTAPSADPKSKEQKRFDRADKNKDGMVTLPELVDPRRKAFAKLDLDHDGKLSFEEWAVRTITKFKTADADGNGQLNRAEYATTAPKHRAKKPSCACQPAPIVPDAQE
ncbi:histidine kinase [Sphingomonas sp. ASV193]|uniref:EF-hand domain-containing protein n=1 Tax=Sphingomonas sp. ASV193 TaxID=3144405 RepID=UPI0032E8A0A9